MRIPIFVAALAAFGSAAVKNEPIAAQPQLLPHRCNAGQDAHAAIAASPDGGQLISHRMHWSQATGVSRCTGWRAG